MSSQATVFTRDCILFVGDQQRGGCYWTAPPPFFYFFFNSFCTNWRVAGCAAWKTKVRLVCWCWQTTQRCLEWRVRLVIDFVWLLSTPQFPKRLRKRKSKRIIIKRGKKIARCNGRRHHFPESFQPWHWSRLNKSAGFLLASLPPSGPGRHYLDSSLPPFLFFPSKGGKSTLFIFLIATEL